MLQERCVEFSGIDKEEILKKILILELSKICCDTDVPAKNLTENADKSEYIFH